MHGTSEMFDRGKAPPICVCKKRDCGVEDLKWKTCGDLLSFVPLARALGWGAGKVRAGKFLVQQALET